MRKGIFTFELQPRWPRVTDVQPPGPSLPAAWTHVRRPRGSSSGRRTELLTRGCRRVPGRATAKGVGRKECRSCAGLGIAAGTAEHGKPAYLPEPAARETVCWKWPKLLCVTLGKSEVTLAGRRKWKGKCKHFPCSVGLKLGFPQVLCRCVVRVGRKLPKSGVLCRCPRGSQHTCYILTR